MLVLTIWGPFWSSTVATPFTQTLWHDQETCSLYGVAVVFSKVLLWCPGHCGQERNLWYSSTAKANANMCVAVATGIGQAKVTWHRPTMLPVMGPSATKSCVALTWVSPSMATQSEIEQSTAGAHQNQFASLLSSPWRLDGTTQPSLDTSWLV